MNLTLCFTRMRNCGSQSENQNCICTRLSLPYADVLPVCMRLYIKQYYNVLGILKLVYLFDYSKLYRRSFNVYILFTFIFTERFFYLKIYWLVVRVPDFFYKSNTCYSPTVVYTQNYKFILLVKKYCLQKMGKNRSAAYELVLKYSQSQPIHTQKKTHNAPESE